MLRRPRRDDLALIVVSFVDATQPRMISLRALHAMLPFLIFNGDEIIETAPILQPASLRFELLLQTPLIYRRQRKFRRLGAASRATAAPVASLRSRADTGVGHLGRPERPPLYLRHIITNLPMFIKLPIHLLPRRQLRLRKVQFLGHNRIFSLNPIQLILPNSHVH